MRPRLMRVGGSIYGERRRKGYRWALGRGSRLPTRSLAVGAGRGSTCHFPAAERPLGNRIGRQPRWLVHRSNYKNSRPRRYASAPTLTLPEGGRFSHSARATNHSGGPSADGYRTGLRSRSFPPAPDGFFRIQHGSRIVGSSPRRKCPSGPDSHLRRRYRCPRRSPKGRCA